MHQALVVHPSSQHSEITAGRYSLVCRKLDRDRDGVVSASELRSALHAINIQLDQATTERLLARLDRNSDGSLQYAEFLQGFERQPEGTERATRPSAAEAHQQVCFEPHLLQPHCLPAMPCMYTLFASGAVCMCSILWCYIWASLSSRSLANPNLHHRAWIVQNVMAHMC